MLRVSSPYPNKQMRSGQFPRVRHLDPALLIQRENRECGMI